MSDMNDPNILIEQWKQSLVEWLAEDEASTEARWKALKSGELERTYRPFSGGSEVAVILLTVETRVDVG